MISDLLFAAGILAAAEGLVLALFPNRLEQALDLVRRLPPDQLRLIGLLACVIGVLAISVSRAWGARMS
jgi:uncharacterized protein YjeT (DUF2065 family)